MRHFITLTSATALVVIFLRAPSPAHVPADIRTAEEAATIAGIKATLKAQVAAWNSGDIPGFMAGYADVKGLRFASGNTVTYGWQTTLLRYQKRYTDRKLMGTLAFKDLSIRPLSPEYAEVFGRFHLARDEDTGDATGLFTLLMQKSNDGWLVLHDHTSAATEPIPDEKPTALPE